jgi:hypothetical protein
MGSLFVDRFSFRSRYKIVSDVLRAKVGTLLDVGARDRVLVRYLDTKRLRYLSADKDGGHDVQVNLELGIPAADREFDYVTSLDVLEHVEAIHEALRELLRVAKCAVIVSLPNMASYRHRFSFLVLGRLGTNKYDLSALPRSDRHRWLSTYRDSRLFVDAIAKERGFRVVEVIGETEGGVMARMLWWCCLSVGLPLAPLLVTRLIFVLIRDDR